MHFRKAYKAIQNISPPERSTNSDQRSKSTNNNMPSNPSNTEKRATSSTGTTSRRSNLREVVQKITRCVSANSTKPNIHTGTSSVRNDHELQASPAREVVQMPRAHSETYQRPRDHSGGSHPAEHPITNSATQRDGTASEPTCKSSKKNPIPCIVVGAGVSGLLTAYHLIHKHGIPTINFESATRAGGRVYTSTADTSKPMHIDVGHSRSSRHDPLLNQLLTDLIVPCTHLEETGQVATYTLGSSDPIVRVVPALRGSWLRAVCGFQHLVKTLMRSRESSVHFGKKLVRLSRHGDVWELLFRDMKSKRGHIVRARAVVLAIPPRKVIEISANVFPKALKDSMKAMRTQFIHRTILLVVYDMASWVHSTHVGVVWCSEGVLKEVYEERYENLGRYVLRGILRDDGRGEAQKNDDEKVAKSAVEQLARIFGPRASSPLAYKVTRWMQSESASKLDRAEGYVEESSFHGCDLTAAAQAQITWGQMKELQRIGLTLASAEMCTEGPGLMDGAIRMGVKAADFVAGFINTQWGMLLPNKWQSGDWLDMHQIFKKPFVCWIEIHIVALFRSEFFERWGQQTHA